MRSFTRAEAVAFDRHAMDELGVPGVVLMENAAIGCVAALRELVGATWPKCAVEIVCGGGNNGGDGYAMARHLLLAGASPRLRPFAPSRAGSDAEINANVCAALAIPCVPIDRSAPDLRGDVLVDALLGTGLDRTVDVDTAALIEAMNRFRGPILAVDLPSGLDADTGEPLGVAVRATVTATMVAPKRGFSAPGAERYTGRVVIVPIGVPA